MPNDKPNYAFFNGEIVPFEQATVSVMTHALNYGTAVFGGIRAYWNDDSDELYIFRPEDHFKRVIQSANLLRIDVGHTPSELTEILKQLLRHEAYRQNAYIRPLAYKAEETIKVRLHGLADAFTIYCYPFGSYVAREEGLHVCFSSWQRVNDNAIPARGKVSGSYVNSALIKSDALLSGYDEALVLTADGHLAEGSAANVMMVRDGKLITSPITDDILEGITRRTMMQLAREDLGLEVVERSIDRTEVYLADEIFMCGTGIQIAAVTQIEHRPIGTGKMGPITSAMRERYFDVVFGRVSQYMDWLVPVYADETVTA